MTTMSSGSNCYETVRFHFTCISLVLGIVMGTHIKQYGFTDGVCYISIPCWWLASPARTWHACQQFSHLSGWWFFGITSSWPINVELCWVRFSVVMDLDIIMQVPCILDINNWLVWHMAGAGGAFYLLDPCCHHPPHLPSPLINTTDITAKLVKAFQNQAGKLSVIIRPLYLKLKTCLISSANPMLLLWGKSLL